MIIISPFCGLGNQMFQYAYARALSEEMEDHIVVNEEFSKFYGLILKLLIHEKNTPKCELWHFKLNQSVRKEKNNKRARGVWGGGVWMLFAYTYHRLFSKHEQGFIKASKRGYFITEDSYTFYKHSICMRKYKYVMGFFQSEKYFENIRNILLKEFSVKTPPSEANRLKIKELQSCNSVCIHIRRGDYLSPQWDFLNVCNEKYYSTGINYIAEHTTNPIFYIFSNDNEEIKWIRENYHFDYPINYIELNNPSYEELRLMYNCKHFIISNSTFSWWGSYLSREQNKIVIAPSKWQTKDYDAPMDIYRQDMVVLDFEDDIVNECVHKHAQK